MLQQLRKSQKHRWIIEEGKMENKIGHKNLITSQMTNPTN